MKYFFIILIVMSCSMHLYSQENNRNDNWNAMFEKYSLDYLRSENPDDIFKLCKKDNRLSSRETDFFYLTLETYISTHIDPTDKTSMIIAETLEDIIDLMEICEGGGTFFQHMRARIGAYSLWLSYSVQKNDKKILLEDIIDDIYRKKEYKSELNLISERYKKCMKDIKKINNSVTYENILWFYINYLK